jgi:hypothetical protein
MNPRTTDGKLALKCSQLKKVLMSCRTAGARVSR